MADCTNVGQPGINISLVDNPIPGNVIVVLSGYTQSALKQTVTVKDSGGNTVATISGTGTNPTSMGVSYFKSPANPGAYTVSITNSGSQTTRVIKSYSSVAFGTTTYLGTWQFIAEDSPSGGDCDFNDCTVYLSWNLKFG